VLAQSFNGTAMPRKRIQDISLPRIKGVTEEVIHLLHHSVVEIVRMRRSIESADEAIARSSNAIFDGCELLKSLQVDTGAAWTEL
jgi:hypothetical protein